MFFRSVQRVNAFSLKNFIVEWKNICEKNLNFTKQSNGKNTNPFYFKENRLNCQKPNLFNILGTNKFSFQLLFLYTFFWPLKKENITEIAIPNTVETELKEADQLFDNGQFKECYEYLRSLEMKFPSNVEILWRMSRSLYQMASEPGIKENIKSKFAFEAYERILEAMELNNNHFAVHKWMSVILDLKSSCIGTKERVQNLEKVKKHMLKAIEINPSDATTLYMLGEWCYRLADMPWYQRKIAQTIFATPPTSNYEEALSYFLKAEVTEPNFYSMNSLMLGKTYLKLGKQDAAKHYLMLALTYPARTNDDHQANKEAQEILKKIK